MFVITPQHRIDEGLIALAFSPKPPQNVPIKAQGDLFLGLGQAHSDGILPTGVGRGRFGVGIAAAHGLFIAHAQIGFVLATLTHGFKLLRRIASPPDRTFLRSAQWLPIVTRCGVAENRPTIEKLCHAHKINLVVADVAPALVLAPLELHILCNHFL